jgi:hypothetical protein
MKAWDPAKTWVCVVQGCRDRATVGLGSREWLCDAHGYDWEPKYDRPQPLLGQLSDYVRTLEAEARNAGGKP